MEMRLPKARYCQKPENIPYPGLQAVPYPGLQAVPYPGLQAVPYPGPKVVFYNHSEENK